MFCKNCGKKIKDSATFCPYCGASTGGTTTAPVKHGTPSVIFPNMGKWLKAFFSKQVVANLDVVAKDTSLAGLIGLLFEILVATNAVAAMNARAIASVSWMSIIKVFTTFLISLFIQYFFIALIVGALLGTLYIVLAVNHKKVGIKPVLNLMFYALIPTTLSFGACLIFALINPIVGLLVEEFLLLPTNIMTIVLLYKGFNKLDTFETEPFYSFALFSMVFVFVVIIIIFVDLVAQVFATAGSFMSNMGDLGDIFRYLR